MKRRFDLKRALSSNPARLLSDKPRRMLAPDAAYVAVHWRKVLSKVQLAAGRGLLLCRRGPGEVAHSILIHIAGLHTLLA